MRCEGAGIVTYGAYIPVYRITPQSIARTWGKNPEEMSSGLGIKMKSVPSIDEDVITISVEAARSALQKTEIDPAEIGAIYVGSESHPYAVKPTATVVAAAIGANPFHTSADFEFACKAGTAGIQTCLGLTCAGMVKYGMAIGADTSQGAPGDALEYTASAGGAAFVLGSEKGGAQLVARITESVSYTTDTPDFWRREGQQYPMHGGRFTGVPAYFKHVITCANAVMERAGTKPEDYTHVVFHQPNGKFPVRAAKQLGFTEKQYERGLLTPLIGNTYSGASMLGLASVLDVAKPGERILVVAYGSGAGSDGFHIEVTDEINNLNRKIDRVEWYLSHYKEIDYAIYAKMRGKIMMRES
jgi:hydroxymethylglutaryl-CoA synthase